ncbi:polysaccharide pyruvyl transferase family protein [Streptomyces sp. NBC_01754]|uniref:polysaccharide pyruvyl transferase family protein n=1 Tax=Streptomyces sp. NBC_01754 TaxID=2975930 RepID=UPI002DDBAC8B|nr:polysaccharide pyruvyl transferase family protein [Streptomyces sp. NBC_01754]WSC96189.1 polysaccharide pyruvyl transferase family protein [Streptomyces sp. NBC_01754]
MRRGLSAVLGSLLRTHAVPGRVLVTGWFSFRDGEVTAGDALAARAVSDALGRSGVSHDVAWSPVFAPDGPALEDARPESYAQLLFVCGPLHGDQILRLHERYAACRRTAIGVSVVDERAPEVTGFHHVLARDRAGAGLMADLAGAARSEPARPLVGVALTHGQGEYGARREHGRAADVLGSWLAAKDCARVEADTRLARDTWRLCRTPDQYLSLVGRLDLMVTDRLHGMVLALRTGVPVLAVDPVRGGAKVSAQARVVRWPAVVPCEDLSPRALDDWWDWCLSSAGREAARRRRTLLLRGGADLDGGP